MPMVNCGAQDLLMYTFSGLCAPGPGFIEPAAWVHNNNNYYGYKKPLHDTLFQIASETL